MTTKQTRWLRAAMAVVGAALCVLSLVLTFTRPAHGQDGQRPVYPWPVCTSVEDVYCAAVLTNTWDGRQVVHQLDPVPSCPPNRTAALQDRLERKDRTLAHVRAKVARLRDRLTR